MSISDRLDEIEQRCEAASWSMAARHLLTGRDVPELVEAVRRRDAALRAVLDACDRIDASLIPSGDFETGQKSVTATMRAVIESALRTPFDADRLRRALGGS